MENNEEYNDEVYSIQEGGSPQEVFTDKKAAQDAADKLNWKRVSELYLSEYCYGLDEILDKGTPEEFFSHLKSIFPGQEFEEEDVQLPKMTLEQYQSLRPYLTLEFYSVKEVKGK